MTAPDSDPQYAFWKAINAFQGHVTTQVSNRWSLWARRHEQRHVHEVVGALLTRQATLACELASSPSTWNAHSGPLFLRSMVENCITIAWILKDPDERAKQFIAYGLGLENLLLEHAKADLRETAICADSEGDQSMDAWERWLNSQRYTFLTEVNVGSWGTDLRKMAEEVGLIELHRKDYARWSSTTHNMWHHVVRFNLEYCTNPLHGYHRVPTVPQLSSSPEFLLCAAEYMDLAVRVFDEATETSVDEFGAVEILNRELQKIPGPPDHWSEDNP